MLKTNKTPFVSIVNKEETVSTNGYSVIKPSEGYQTTKDISKTKSGDNMMAPVSKADYMTQSAPNNSLSIDSDKFNALLKLLGLDNESERTSSTYRSSVNDSVGVTCDIEALQVYIDKLDEDLHLNVDEIHDAKDRVLFKGFFEVVADNFQNPKLRREFAASTLNLSERHLNRKLTQYEVINFSNYLKKYRLKQALFMLGKGFQVAQIGEKVGFSSTTYFCSCFKSEFGRTVKSLEKEIKRTANA